MTRGILSLACWMVLIIWTSKLSLAEELSSQAEAPEQLTNNELQQLLKILDEPASKEVPHFDSHPLLHLGELLLDDDDSPKDETIPSTTTTTPRPTTITTTTPQPPISTPAIQISRRDDTEPSNEQLVQQLSLFNSLLMSLSAENATTPAPDGPPPLTAQQVALLQSLFGNLSTPQTTETSLFLKRQTEAPKTPSPSSPEIAALTELLTKIAKAPADANGNLNLQSIVGGGGEGNVGHLKNFHNSNANMDPAASNQLSGLLTLLGTLGSLTQTQQQLQSTGSLFNFGTPTVASPISNNFLAGLLQPQAQPSQQNPNIFGNLFNQHQPQAHEQQSFNLGNLGLGSVISTMSNILGGSGAGGKPRVRGVDTRLGLGYRFGDAADAQIMWDIGPQLFTDPLQNEAPRYPMTKQKRQDSSPPHHPTPPGQQIQAAAKVEKEQQQQLAASRRYFQLHQQGKYHSPTRRNFFINPPTTTRKPYNHISNLTPYAQEQALKELWQLMEMKKQMDRANKASQNALGMLTPADLYQMQRNKHVIKRASTPQSNLNEDPTIPTVFKPEAEPHTAESFLRFRKIAPNAHSSFSKKSTGGLHRNHPPSPQPLQASPPSGGVFSLSNIFEMFMSPHSKQKLRSPNRNNFNSNSRPPPQESPSSSGGGMSGSPSQMSRWDMENHRFDNFKNTNGELVMTDSNANDRFNLRNINRNGGFLGA